MEPLDRPLVSPALVGRAKHLEALGRCLEAARQGRGQTVFVAGEAGIGKSRLVAEVSARAEQDGISVLQGQCFESDHSLPYAPLADLLRTAIRSFAAPAALSPEDLAQLLGPSAAELASLLPELAGSVPATASSPSVLHREQDKHSLHRALTEAIACLGAGRPALVVIEDAHWSDDASLDFLLEFARHIVSRAALLLVTYRSDEIGPSLSRLLADLDRRRLAAEVRLTRLDRAAVDEMLRAIFRLHRPVRPEFLDAILTLTDGNPFFIEEVLRSMLSSGDLPPSARDGLWDRWPGGEVRVPRSVQEAVTRRSERLSDEARRTLALAAVAGRRFDFALLQALTGHDEAALLGSMRELVAAGLVVEESPERFGFRHALTREAVYSGLLARERRALHREVGETMERLHARDPSALEVRAGDLAYHFSEANEWAKALRHAEHAGHRALGLYAPRAAIEHFTRALEAVRHLNIAPSPEVLRARGQAYQTQGEFALARADFEATLGQAQSMGDRPTEWQALLDLGEVWMGRDYECGGRYYRQALELARELGDPLSIARSLNRVGNWHVNLEQSDEAIDHHHEALELFRALNDQHGIAETLDLMGMASYLGGNPVQGSRYYEQAVALFRELDDRQGLSSALATLGGAHGGGHLADLMTLPPTAPDSPQRDAELAAEVAREIGWRAGEAYALNGVGSACIVRGAYARGAEAARMALLIAEEIEHREWIVGGHCALGTLYLDLFALPEARQHLDRALALARETGSLYWVRYSSALGAWARVAQGDYAQAEAVLDGLIDLHGPARTWAARVVCWAHAELALARGDPSSALSLADALIASDANATADRSPRRLLKLRGEALGALGRTAEAENALRAARHAAGEQGARPLLWRIYSSLGRLYAADGRRLEAEGAFTAARALVEELAAEVSDEALRMNFLERATALLPRPRPLNPRHAAKRAFGGLTEREREVAALIARGKSNPEIAEALVIGERTVHTHVSHILGKLGFGSRAQIAAWAAEKGLLAGDAR